MAAVPGRVTSRMAQGTNSLLQEGAAAHHRYRRRPRRALRRRRAAAPRIRAEREAGPADPLLRAVPAAAEGGASVEAIASSHRPQRGADARGPRPPGGRRLPRPARPGRVGAGRVLRRGSGRRAEAAAGRPPILPCPWPLTVFPGCSRSQARTRAAAPASRPTSRRLRRRLLGTSAIIALTAQNTVGVTAVYPLPPELIVERCAPSRTTSAWTRRRPGCSAPSSRSRPWRRHSTSYPTRRWSSTR